MESIYSKQVELAENIKKILINFRKDSIQRKTIEYCKQRLELLESYKNEYEINNEKLMPYETTNHKYFTDSEFERTRDLYYTAKTLISEFYDELLLRSKKSLFPKQSDPTQEHQEQPLASRPQPQPTSGSASAFASKGSTSKLDDMYRKQHVNFKAFMRAVDSINVESMREKWEFEDTLRILQQRWTAVDNLHWEIIGEIEEDEAYEIQYNSHEDIFNSIRKSVNSKMWSVSYRDKSIPQMDIPIFTGNFQQWVSFKDLFDESINKNPALSNAQKMQLLKSKVKGEAERLIQHLTISSDNYIICWEILNHRFNNKKLIFSSHANMFLNLPYIQQQSFTAIKRLHDVTVESLHAIKNLGIDISTWDPLLVHILSNKLDSESYSEYIESLKNAKELPNLKDFLDFLENKFTTLESSRRRQDGHPKSSPSYQPNFPSKSFNNRNYSFNNSNNTPIKPATKSLHVSAVKCPVCFADHVISNCKKFQDFAPDKKLKTINQLQYCVNCMFDHNGNKCFSTKRCHKCSKNHHTMLHDSFEQKSSLYQQKKNLNEDKPSRGVSYSATHASQQNVSEILLATALVRVTAADGTQHTLRALVDQGSQASLISYRSSQLLGLKREACKGSIFGIGEKENSCKGVINITCQSMHSDFSFSGSVLIMDQLIKSLPNRSFLKPSWSQITHLTLADPEFYLSRPIDLLLGVEIYPLIMLDGVLRPQGEQQILLQQTQLGWLLCGTVNMTYNVNVVLNNLEQINQFWKIEDIQETSQMSAEDQECVEFYQSTTKRLENGRYEVRLPMKREASENLGSSKEIASAQYRSLEGKFRRQEHLAKQYKQFMSEYEALGHMRVATPNNQRLQCFLPHHAVQKTESLTTPCRIVFNAASKTSSGLSLNDLMHKGPNLQQDLQQLILKWRQYRYAYVADIAQMYRQIIMNEDDQKLQQIIWRYHQDQPIRAYQLTTVAFGTKAAPFLAMMTLRQLAADEQYQYPNAAKSLCEDFFMDDLVSGAYSLEEGKQKIKEIITCLSKGGFLLRKWSANNVELLKSISQSELSTQSSSFTFKSDNTSKTLGIRWDPNKDIFTFKYDNNQTDIPKLTKRILLSEISKTYDPIGWICPLITKMKLLFQKVWLNSDMQWNDEVADTIKEEWLNLKKDLDCINNVEIPRWIQNKQDDVIEMHGFCDASTKAYASVVYARVIRGDAVTVVLVAAKSRLVPNSKEITLPRLELCAAELLARLMSKIITSLSNINIKAIGWSDSQITLSWLQNKNPDHWKPFVSNRVKKVISVIPSENWFYVNTKENPADVASRGLSASQLVDYTLWWRAPSFLYQHNFESKHNQIKYKTNEEMKKQTNSVQQINTENSIIKILLNRYSSFTKINRILAWILRVGDKPGQRKQSSEYLTLHELRRAHTIIIKYVQRKEFLCNVEYLSLNKRLKSDSKLLSLNPFLDKEGVLRVGGRLRNACINDAMKYPIIIPYRSKLTELLIDKAHKNTLHGGARLTLSILRHKYWIIKGNSAVKQQLRKCVICRKQEPRQLSQIMGDLPDFRTNPAPSFYHTGTDYTGFIKVKASKGKGVRTSKGYIALFICMVTKAVHLEIVSDLTSASFIAALHRMAARRGAPKHIYSDNGTNYVGANKILQEEYQQLKNVFDESFYREIADMEIEWHWNCPSWPSAGGIWERSIRSLKQHLKRVVGEQALTFEEYSTVLARIEANLNSRPLCPLSDNVEDLDFLTPGHFLNNRGDLTVIQTPQDARTRWYLTNKIFTDLWKRWKTEYLTQLSVRSKWTKLRSNIEIGDMVTIHDDQYLPAGRWPVGRVVELHPGKDGQVRVVTLKTKNGYIKRPVLKLSILPVYETKESTQEKQSSNSSQQESESKPESGRKIINYPKLVNVVLSLLFFMSHVEYTTASYNFTQFDRNHSLYFDPIGKMHLIKDKWTIVAYYNMKPYWQGDRAISEFTKYLDQTCKQVNEQSYCHMVLLQIKHDYDEIQFNNKLLLNQHFDARRVRRGLINAIGSLANTLFGVLDDSFAQKYKQDIELVQSNEKHINQLWKNQTSIIEAEYNILKRTEETINKQHKIISKHLLKLDNVTSELQLQYNHLALEQTFTLTAMTCMNLIQNLKRIQDTLIDTITEIYHGQINIHLITPKQLREELQLVSGQISNEYALPIDDIQSKLFEVYKLLKIKARMTNEYFIFEITLPLISRDNFELYKLIPIPVQVGKNMMSVKPVAEFVAINLRRDAYITAGENILQDCQYFDNMYLCPSHGPIRHLDTEETFSESEPVKTACSNKWIQLHDPSFYLYFCCDTYSLRIICDDEVRQYQLSKAGLVYLSKQCVIKGRDVTLYSYQHLQSTLTISPNIVDSKLPSMHDLLNITHPILNEYELGDDNLGVNISLQNLNEQIKSMKESAQQIDTLTSHDIHNYALSYGLLAAGIAVAIWFIWRSRRRSIRLAANIAPPGLELSEIVSCENVNECSKRSVSVSSEGAILKNSIKQTPKPSARTRDNSTQSSFRISKLF